jgi:hypothetical protein
MRSTTIPAEVERELRHAGFEVARFGLAAPAAQRVRRL